jgi:hypothetical protein
LEAEKGAPTFGGTFPRSMLGRALVRGVGGLGKEGVVRVGEWPVLACGLAGAKGSGRFRRAVMPRRWRRAALYSTTFGSQAVRGACGLF